MSAAHVKGIPATRAIEPGIKATYAKMLGFQIEHCGASCDCVDCDGRQRWEGYIYLHPALGGESEDAYESAEDCAVAALQALAQRLALDTEGVLVPRAELAAVDMLLMVSGMRGNVEEAQKKVAVWLGWKS